MFRKKAKEDPTELQLLKIRVQNLEKEIAEMKRAPQVHAEERKDYLLPIASNKTSLAASLINPHSVHTHTSTSRIIFPLSTKENLSAISSQLISPQIGQGLFL